VYALQVALPPGLARKSRFSAPTRGRLSSRIGACEAHVHGRSNWRPAPQHVALAWPAPRRTVRSSLRHSVYARSVLGDPAALAKPLPSMSPECADGRRRESGAGKWWLSTRLAGRRGSREQRGRPLLMIRPRVWIRRPSGRAARSTSLRPRHPSADSGSEVLVETQEGSRHA